MADDFASYASGLSSLASDAFEITPGATALAKATRAIYVGGGGDVTVTMLSGASVTFTAGDGAILPVRATHVTAATATDLVGLV